MKAVGIKVLKDRLSHYVRLAASGETILVTDRDEVVAELGPPSPGRAPSLEDAQLAEMVRGGLIRPATGPRGTLPPRFPRMPLEQILRTLDQDRAERT